jgi:hypothetical protein
MDTYTMISSINGGPFNNSNRYIDFDIPSNHIIDMSQCFVQLECSITPAQELSASGSVVNLVLKNAVNTALTPMNVDLVKNCWLNSQKKSLRLEDIRKVNVLRHNLLELTQSSSQKLSHPDSLSQVRTFDNAQLASGFTQLTKVGSVPSSYVNNMLRIPLSHLFELGSAKIFDTNKLGVCRVHLELDNLSNVGVDVSVNWDTEETECQPIGSGGGNVVILKRVYDTLELSPWHVGMIVFVEANSDGGSDVTTNTLITSIAYDEPTGIISLTLELTIPTLIPPATYETVSVTPLDFAAVIVKGSFSILQASLGVAYNDALASQSNYMMEYLTYTTEEYSANAQSMHKIFDVEPNSVNCMLMFQDPTNPSNVISNNTNVVSYRMRVDNDDVYNRDIYVNNLISADIFSHDPLHYDSLTRLFVNSNLTLKNLQFASFTRDVHNDDTEGMLTSPTNQILILGCPLPFSATSKKVQFDIECQGMGGEVKNVILYKQVIKQVNLM